MQILYGNRSFRTESVRVSLDTDIDIQASRRFPERKNNLFPIRPILIDAQTCRDDPGTADVAVGQGFILAGKPDTALTDKIPFFPF